MKDDAPCRQISKWPRLSETLNHQYRKPNTCQSCGRSPNSEAEQDAGFIQAWIEHDDNDKPTSTVVLLCPSCSRRLIEPHPRLYGQDRAINKPRPGSMPHLCTDCAYRTGVDCTHPNLKANGGAGLNITVKLPSGGFWDGQDKQGRRTGGMFEVWETAKACAGREEKTENIR